MIYLGVILVINEYFHILCSKLSRLIPIKFDGEDEYVRFLTNFIISGFIDILEVN